MAAEEVFEETGYQVDADRLEQFGKFRRIDSGAYQNLFYVEVTNVDRVGEGGGLAVAWVNKYVSNETQGGRYEKYSLTTTVLCSFKCVLFERGGG